jgi:hypothetical protein
MSETLRGNVTNATKACLERVRVIVRVEQMDAETHVQSTQTHLL